MENILKIFHYLLWYPDELFSSRIALLKENLLVLGNETLNTKINSLYESFSKMPLNKLEELYSQTFDWNTIQSLYIGYYLFGESYYRSNFLTNLLEIFQRFEYSPDVSDLPDHLSILLDFISTSLEGSVLLEFIDNIITTALDKMLHISVPQNEKQNDYFNLNNPYFVLISLLYEFLNSYMSNEIILTTI